MYRGEETEIDWICGEDGEGTNSEENVGMVSGGQKEKRGTQANLEGLAKL